MPLHDMSDGIPHAGAPYMLLRRKGKWTMCQSVHLYADKTRELRASVKPLFQWKFSAQPALYIRRNKSTDFAPEPRDFLDKLGTQERVRFSRQHENGFNFIGKTSVHQSHLQLIFVIGDGSDAPDDHGSFRRFPP